MRLVQMLRSIPLLAMLACAACAGGPPIVTASAAGCSSLVPDSWKQGVAGADCRGRHVLGDWIVFGDAQTGKLDQANGRTKDAIGIVERCEARDAKQAYLSGARDGTAAFQGALAAYKALRAAEPASTVKCADGTVITAPGVCPVPPPVVTPPPALTLGGHAKAITTCQSLTNVADVLTLNATYTVVGFAGFSPIGAVTSPTAREVVVLNDATHLGDGWFGIYVPVSCVAPAA
jgi:hypothetical protein